MTRPYLEKVFLFIIILCALNNTESSMGNLLISKILINFNCVLNYEDMYTDLSLQIFLNVLLFHFISQRHSAATANVPDLASINKRH